MIDVAISTSKINHAICIVKP